MTSKRTTERHKAAIVLGRIRVANPKIPGVNAARLKAALELAISLLEARAVDGEEDSQ
jgi:hypothetical protein